MVLLTVGRLSCDAECFNDELFLSDELLLGVAAVEHGSEIGVGNDGVGKVGDLFKWPVIDKFSGNICKFVCT
jgi:hypothetical protein